MADKKTIELLMEVAKGSLVFAGLSENDIWQACVAYQDRSDEDVKLAIDKIKAKDQLMRNEALKKKNQLVNSVQLRKDLLKGENIERALDLKEAEKLLKELFK